MKSMATFLLMGCVALACNDQATTSEQSEPAGDTTQIEYAYTTDHPADNWVPGNQQHAAMVLKSLKAFENGNLDEAIRDFADSVTWSMDYFEQKMSKDSLKAMMQQYRDDLTSYSIKMDDWESVISKDKKTEWVSLWYRQYWTEKSGKSDSLICMDDVKIENGKIAEIDEKVRHFPAKK